MSNFEGVKEFTIKTPKRLLDNSILETDTGEKLVGRHLEITLNGKMIMRNAGDEKVVVHPFKGEKFDLFSCIEYGDGRAIECVINAPPE